MTMRKSKGKGAIVGATLTTHIPWLFLEGEARENYISTNPSNFFEALPKMHEEQIRKRGFDTFLVIDTHWWTTTDFIVDGRSNFSGQYTSDEVPHMIRNYHYSYSGDRTLAMKIAEVGQKTGLPVKVSDDKYLPVHYSTLVPMHYLNPYRRLGHRVLPMSIAYASSVEQELRYGEAIRKAIEASGQKVVIVASGGLSHKFWPIELIKDRAGPNPENISGFNRRFDLDIIRWLKEGGHKSVLASVDEFRREAGPEGRFAHYLRMVGALGGAECTLKGIQYGNYEAAIGTGQVILWFNT